MEIAPMFKNFVITAACLIGVSSSVYSAERNNFKYKDSDWKFMYEEKGVKVYRLAVESSNILAVRGVGKIEASPASTPQT